MENLSLIRKSLIVICILFLSSCASSQIKSFNSAHNTEVIPLRDLRPKPKVDTIRVGILINEQAVNIKIIGKFEILDTDNNEVVAVGENSLMHMNGSGNGIIIGEKNTKKNNLTENKKKERPISNKNKISLTAVKKIDFFFY